MSLIGFTGCAVTEHGDVYTLDRDASMASGEYASVRGRGGNNPSRFTWVTFTDVNGEDLTRRYPKGFFELRLPPGQYAIGVHYERRIYTKSIMEWVTITASARQDLNVQARGTYVVRAQEIGNDMVAIWVEDAVTAAVVAGQKPRSAFGDGQ